MDSEAKRVIEEFWPKIKRTAGKIPFARDALAAFYCAVDRDTPSYAKAVIFGALGYFIIPFDAVPDWLPLLGFTDDAAAIAAAIGTIRAHIKERHFDAADAWLAEPAGDAPERTA